MMGCCETNLQGGCKCLCSLVDRRNSLKRYIKNEVIYEAAGCKYTPSKSYKTISDKERAYHDDFVKNVARAELEEVEKKIKKYVITQSVIEEN